MILPIINDIFYVTSSETGDDVDIIYNNPYGRSGIPDHYVRASENNLFRLCPLFTMNGEYDENNIIFQGTIGRWMF